MQSDRTLTTPQPDAALSPDALRGRIQDFEDILLEHPQVEIPVTQYFCGGVYLRRIDIPAGTLMTGKIHKHPCLSIILSGEMEVITDAGPKHVKAPLIYASPAGVKRAGRALTDCIWVTAHANPDNVERSAEAMAALLTVDTFEQLEAFQREQLEDKSCQS